MTNCQLLQCVTSHMNIKCQETLKISWSLSVDFYCYIHLTISLATRGKTSIKSRETEKHSYSSTHASCDHGSEKRQFSQNFPIIMNSQAHKTLRWHTQPGCFWALVKQTGPTGWMCSVTVSGCGSLCRNADDFPSHLARCSGRANRGPWSKGAALWPIISWKDSKEQQEE